MIHIGYTAEQKRAAIAAYQAKYGLTHTVVISADDFSLPIEGTDQVKYSDVIMYVTYYRLLQEIDQQTLVVINECLRTQNRYDLAYNCIRNYLNQTNHQLIFQQLPLIDTSEDFMVLFDFDTKSRWKRRPFDPLLIQKEVTLQVNPLPVGFQPIAVPTSAKTKAKYDKERAKLFAELGKRDPHTIPRNLYLIGGEDKAAYINGQSLPLFTGPAPHYVARNQRLGLSNITTYDLLEAPPPYTLVEFPHRFIDFSDFLQRTWQAQNSVLVADLKIDAWYLARYQEWSNRIHATYASLS